MNYEFKGLLETTIKYDEQLYRIGLAFAKNIAHCTFTRSTMQSVLLDYEYRGNLRCILITFHWEKKPDIRIHLKNNVSRLPLLLVASPLARTPQNLLPENEFTNKGSHEYYRALICLGYEAEAEYMAQSFGLTFSVHERLEWTLEYEARLEAQGISK